MTRRARSTERYISFRRLRVCRFGPKSGHSEGHFPGQSGTPDFDENVFVPPPVNFLLCISICRKVILCFSIYLFVSELDLRASVKNNLAKIRDLAYLRPVRREFLSVVALPCLSHEELHNHPTAAHLSLPRT